MKKNLIAAISAVALAFVATSCTSVMPGYGFAGPAVTGNDVKMEKTGEATGKFLFGYIPLTSADCSVKAAAENGGIKKIATVDTKTVWPIGIPLLVVQTTIVTGE